MQEGVSIDLLTSNKMSVSCFQLRYYILQLLFSN